MKIFLLLTGAFFIYWNATHPATLPGGKPGFPLGFIIGGVLMLLGFRHR